ncbi:ethylene-responsive transcription factor 5-like [Cryptomeria japonica]|uniref:ethylene-responsive transcription factor 5-like n=1 Tax=Cryptomeria japonica TaxID=3369 RepID=UPI0025ABF457|nr:ethylene-responsive transcription factor 5-like [Cryptomeria japonica]
MSTPTDEEKRMLNAIGQFLLGEEYMTTAPAEEQQSSEESGTSFASEGTGNKKKGGEKHYRGVMFVEARAAVAYDRKAFKIRGSRAILNFPLNVEFGQYVDPFPQSPSSHTPSNIPRKRKTYGKDECQSFEELDSY